MPTTPSLLVALALVTPVHGGEARADNPITIHYARRNFGELQHFTADPLTLRLVAGERIAFVPAERPLTIHARGECKRRKRGFPFGIGGDRRTVVHVSMQYDITFQFVFVPRKTRKAPISFSVPYAGPTETFVAPTAGELIVVPVAVAKLDDEVIAKLPACARGLVVPARPWVERDELPGSLRLQVRKEKK